MSPVVPNVVYSIYFSTFCIMSHNFQLCEFDNYFVMGKRPKDVPQRNPFDKNNTLILLHTGFQFINPFRECVLSASCQKQIVFGPNMNESVVFILQNVGRFI